MMELVKSVSKKIESVLKKQLKIDAEVFIEEIKQVILNEYENKLMVFKPDNKSKIDYNSYRDEFILRLDNFQFIKDNENGITLDVPDMETFDFSDGLELIETIMEGLSGVYVEANEQEYSYIFGRKPRLVDAIDKSMSPKNRTFLIRYIGKVRRAEKELNTRFVRFPFSNTPPIDILEAGKLFVDENIDQWVNDSIEQANKEVVNGSKF